MYSSNVFFRFAVTLKSLKSNIFLKYMIKYIRFTTKDTSSKYITCTLVVSELSVLKPYKYMSLSNILKPYIFYLSSDCETFFNIWKHKSIACVFFTPSNLLFNSVIKHRMSLCMGKPQFWFLNRSDTNQAVQTQQMARGWKF